MALSAKVGSLSTTTGAVGATVVVSGLGFQPKALIFWWNGRTDTVDAAGSDSHQLGVGFATGTTDRRIAASESFDGQTTTQADRSNRDDACIATINNAAAQSWDGRMDVQSIDADGFTLVIDEVFSKSLRVHFLAVGGDDISNVETGRITEAAAAGNQTVTLAGAFQPDVVLFTGGHATTEASIRGDSSWFVGFATRSPSTVQAVLLEGSDDGLTTTDCQSYCRADECIAMFASGMATIDGRAAVNQWNSDGFQLNWIERAALRFVEFLAIKGGQWLVGDLLTQTDTVTDIVESGFGFQPAGALFISACRAASTADAFTAHAEASIGAFDSTTSRAAFGVGDENGVTTSECSTMVEYDEIYVNPDLADGVEGLMDVKSVESGGFTCIMDDADPAQSFVAYLAMGSAAAGGGAVVVPQRTLLGVGL